MLFLLWVTLIIQGETKFFKIFEIKMIWFNIQSVKNVISELKSLETLIS